MTEVVWVALITGASTVLVATAGNFGASWRDARQRRAEGLAKVQSERYSGAEDLVQAMLRWRDEEEGSEARLDRATVAFIATLGPGEGRVSRWVYAERKRIAQTVNLGGPTSGPVLDFANRLFAYLRGETPLSKLPDPSNDEIIITVDSGRYPRPRFHAEGNVGVKRATDDSGDSHDHGEDPAGPTENNNR